MTRLASKVEFFNYLRAELKAGGSSSLGAKTIPSLLLSAIYDAPHYSLPPMRNGRKQQGVATRATFRPTESQVPAPYIHSV